MVSADPFCVAPPRSSLLDHHHLHQHQHHHHHHQLQHHHVQHYLDSSSTTKSSSVSSPAASTPTSKPRTREVASRYKSPAPDVASRYRSPSPAPASTSSSTRRFASPSVDRSSYNALDSSKRAVSAERRRPSPTRDASTTAARRTSTSSTARSELLWPSTRNLYSSMQADSYTPPPKSPAKTRPESRGRSASNSTSDHTLKPSLNATQRPVDQRKKTPERKGTPVRRHSFDQAENAKPSESFQTKPEPVLKHRWPSSLSSLKLYGTAMSKSVDLTADQDRHSSRSRTMSMLQSRPTSFSSQVISRAIPNSAGIFSQTINDSSVLRSAARKLSLESKTRPSGRDSPLRSSRGISSRDSNSPSLSQSESQVDLVRQSDEEAELASESSSVGDDSLSGSRSTSGKTTPRASSRSRTPSDAYRLRMSSQDNVYSSITGLKQPGSRQKLTPSSDTRGGQSLISPWPGVPQHLVASYKFSYSQSVSPVKSPMSTRSWPSPTRSRVSTLSSSSSMSAASRNGGITSTLHFTTDYRKSRKGLSNVEAAFLHRILHNRLLQWRFANARADLANTIQRQAGEKLLFSVWAKTAEIRKSVTAKRLKLQQARHAQKLNSILRMQGSKLETWSSVQQDHSNALSGCIEALESAVLRIPVDEGVKADTQAVKEAIISAVEVVHTVESSVNRLLPKMDKTNGLISELAQVADLERTLLEECGDLLLLVSSFEVEERSLRMQLLQFDQEKKRVLGHLIDNAGVGHGSI